MTITLNGDTGITQSGLFDSNSDTGFKNRIINGAMFIDQRNNGAVQTIANGSYAYTIDRFRASSFGATCSGQRIFSVSNNQFLYRFTGNAGVTNINFNQRIESVNCYDMANNTATLSVNLANSLLTSVSWVISYANGSDNFSGVTTISSGTFTVNSTLTNYSIQVALPANTINGLQIDLTVGAQTSGTWQIGQVQLEKGSVATGFDYRSYGTELGLCQRYYYKVFPGAINSQLTAAGVCANTTTASNMTGVFPVVMRISPTALEQNGTAAHYRANIGGIAAVALSSVPVYGTATNQNIYTIGGTVASGLTLGYPVTLQTNDTTAYLAWSAEL